LIPQITSRPANAFWITNAYPLLLCFLLHSLFEHLLKFAEGGEKGSVRLNHTFRFSVLIPQIFQHPAAPRAEVSSRRAELKYRIERKFQDAGSCNKSLSNERHGILCRVIIQIFGAIRDFLRWNTGRRMKPER